MAQPFSWVDLLPLLGLFHRVDIPLARCSNLRALGCLKHFDTEENGDRPRREEFHRHHEATPENFRAEVIEGVVHLASAARHEQHGGPHRRIVSWAGYYAAMTDGVESGGESSILLDDLKEPQPKAILRLSPSRRGQPRTTGDGSVELATEVVAEVAASSASHDLHSKFEAQRRNGVREHLIWRVLDLAMDWFTPGDGAYEGLEPGTSRSP